MAEQRAVCAAVPVRALLQLPLLGVNRGYKGLYGGGWPLRGMGAAGRSKTGPRFLGFGFVAKHRFHFIVGRPRTHVISSLDFGSRVYLRPQWELARSLAERRLLAERE